MQNFSGYERILFDIWPGNPDETWQKGHPIKSRSPKI